MAAGIEIDSGYVHLQVKATDDLTLLKDKKTVTFSVDTADVLDWDSRFHPVIFIVYDAKANKAYWLHVQPYLEENRSKIGSAETITFHIRFTHGLQTASAAKQLRSFGSFFLKR